MPASANSSAAFGQLKSLAGTWEGQKSHDVPVTVTYTVVSNGSAVMERLQAAHEPEMITILFHGQSAHHANRFTFQRNR